MVDLLIFPARSPGCQFLSGGPPHGPVISQTERGGDGKMQTGLLGSALSSLRCTCSKKGSVSCQRICGITVAFLEGFSVHLNSSKRGCEGEDDPAARPLPARCVDRRAETEQVANRRTQPPGLTAPCTTDFLATAGGRARGGTAAQRSWACPRIS